MKRQSIKPTTQAIIETVPKTPVQELADNIKAISNGIRELRNGPLTDKALYLLIQNAAPNVGGKYSNSPLSQKEIRAVFEGIENLEALYLKPKKKS